jgi:hypothetical protein
LHEIEPPPISPYPRPVWTETQLDIPTRLVRGFVIGNYWWGVIGFIVLAIGFGLAATGNLPHSTKREATPPGFIVFLSTFFVIGFLIGALSKRKSVSLVFAIGGSICSWFVLGSGILGLKSTPGLLLWPAYAALGTFAAIYVNKKARDGQSPPQ